MKRIINCIAIDDEPMALEILANHIQRIPFLKLLKEFRSAMEALEFIKRNKIDVVFLDINMPDINGIQFIDSISNPPRVVFTTAYPEYAVKSYELDAIDYLLKPIEFERFLKASGKILDSLTDRAEAFQPGGSLDQTITLKSGTKAYNIHLGDLLFIEGAGNYSTFHTTEKSLMVLMTLTEIQNTLPASQFKRIHKSYIVSLSKINTIESHQLTIGNKTLPIGNIYRQSFFNVLNKS